MARPLPKWIMQKYALLWKKYKQNEFDHSQASAILKDNTSVILTYLKKYGWISVGLNPDDSRKRTYNLKSPEQAILEMTDEEKK